MANRILPLELIDKAIGSSVWVLMRGKSEIVGTLRGFDDYVSAIAERCIVGCCRGGMLLVSNHAVL